MNNVHIIPKFTGSLEMKFDPKNKYQSKKIENLVKSSQVTKNLYTFLRDAMQHI